ncbi:MAG: FAD:protein FMN transferase, partial [Lactovum sp.]
GTVIDISINHKNADSLLNDVIDKLKEYEMRFSANNNESELMSINLNAGKKWVKAGQDLFDLIEIGKNHSIAANSYLNIAIGPLTKAWNIGFSDSRKPSETEIEKLLTLINPEKIQLNPEKQSVFLEEGMAIDLGALAKGYIADLIMTYLKEQGAIAALINLGGNVMTFGDAPSEHRTNWRIGIRNPTKDRNSYSKILQVKNKSVVTSGIYERTLKTKDQTYHHIFNSSTGYPIKTPVLSLTIISDKSVDGEIWTSRLFGHEVTEILNVVEKLEDIETLIITKENIYQSSGMTKYL